MSYEYVNESTGEFITEPILHNMLAKTSDAPKYDWMTFTNNGDLLTIQWWTADNEDPKAFKPEVFTRTNTYDESYIVDTGRDVHNFSSPNL